MLVNLCRPNKGKPVKQWCNLSVCECLSNRKQRWWRDSAQVDALIRTRRKKLQNIRQGTSDIGSQWALQREDNPLGPCGNCWSEVSAVTHFTAPSLPESAPTPLRLRHDSGAAWERAAHAHCAQRAEKGVLRCVRYKEPIRTEVTLYTEDLESWTLCCGGGLP